MDPDSKGNWFLNELLWLSNTTMVSLFTHLNIQIITVAASPWKDGKGDLLEEISKSATKYDMNMGVYLSPWDVNSPKYKVATQKEYNEYYLNQLKEILGNPKYGNKGRIYRKSGWMEHAVVVLKSNLYF